MKKWLWALKYTSAHICCRLPTLICYSNDEAEADQATSSERSSISYPAFPRNIGAFISHLTYNHLGQNHITPEANDILQRMDTQVIWKISPLFQSPTCVRKSSSETCLKAPWKSNQTELTINMANYYVFHETKCKGHSLIVYY